MENDGAEVFVHWKGRLLFDTSRRPAQRQFAACTNCRRRLPSVSCPHCNVSCLSVHRVSRDVLSWQSEASPPLFLGMVDDSHPAFACDVSHLPNPVKHPDEDDPLRTLLRGDAASVSFVDARRLMGALSSFEGNVVAQTRALFHWHRKNSHCPACGAATAVVDGGHARTCAKCSTQLVRGVVSCCVVLCCVVLCRVVLCRVVSCCVVLCCVVLCCVVSCRVVLCCVVLSLPLTCTHSFSLSSRSASGRQYPRTDPAIITLVLDNEDASHALLGRSIGWPAGVFSCLAGFVEGGETLEQAVGREVLEEVGVRATAPHYFSSQPWPPQSLMVGFHARASRTDPVVVDTAEMDDAQWFTKEQVEAALARAIPGRFGTDDSAELVVPPSGAIANAMLQAWVAGQLPHK